jgi:O-antigen ligase
VPLTGRIQTSGQTSVASPGSRRTERRPRRNARGLMGNGRMAATTARRVTFLALVIFGAGVPLLPTSEFKVAATLYAACVLAVAWYARLRAGDPLDRTPLDAPAATFLLAAALATVLSPDPVAGVFSASLRGDGLLVDGAFILMALAAARLPRQEGDALVAALLYGGSLVAGIAVAQYYGWDVTRWTARMGMLPAFPSAGTLGNRIFLGGYLSLLLPICVALAAGGGEWTWGGCAALLYAGLIASETRAAWAGSAAGGVLLLWRLRPHRGTARRLVFLGAVLASITAVMALTQPHGALGERAMSTFNPHDPSLGERLVLDRQTLSLIQKRPVLGWGFSVLLGRRPGMSAGDPLPEAGDRPPAVDTTHNEILHIAYATGAVGLGAYLWVWATLLTRLRASRPPSEARPDLPAGLFASCIAYFIWLQMAWSHLGPANAFWVLAGIAVALTRTRDTPEGRGRPPQVLLRDRDPRE